MTLFSHKVDKNHLDLLTRVGRTTYPVGTSVLGLPLIQLRLGLGIHFDQEFLVAQKQLVEKPEGSQSGLRLLILTEAEGFKIIRAAMCQKLLNIVVHV